MYDFSCLSVSGCLANLEQLETLLVSKNKLTTDGVTGISNLRCLRILDLSGNDIDDFHAVTHLQELRSLDISGNPAATTETTLVELISQMTSLLVMNGVKLNRERIRKEDASESRQPSASPVIN